MADIDIVTYLQTKNVAAEIADDDFMMLVKANGDLEIVTGEVFNDCVADGVDAALTASGLTDALTYKGAIDCSANPDYPAADAGHFYRISAAGKIGGASGVTVEAGDSLICNTDATVSGNQATVGAFWNIFQANIDITDVVLKTALFDATNPSTQAYGDSADTGSAAVAARRDHKHAMPAAYSHPTGDGNIHVPATSTTNNGKVLTAGATAGALSWETPSSSGHAIQDEGTPLTARSTLNFVGSGVTVTDDSENNATKVTINGGGASSGAFAIDIDGGLEPTADASFSDDYYELDVNDDIMPKSA